GLRLELLAVDLLEDPLLRAPAGDEVESPRLALEACDVLVERAVGREAGGVRQEMAKRDAPLPVHAEVVEVARHAIVDRDPSLLHQEEEREGGRERLRER